MRPKAQVLGYLICGWVEESGRFAIPHPFAKCAKG